MFQHIMLVVEIKTERRLLKLKPNKEKAILLDLIEAGNKTVEEGISAALEADTEAMQSRDKSDLKMFSDYKIRNPKPRCFG